MWGIIKFVFKAVWFVMKTVGSVIAWAGTHILVASAVSAAILAVGVATDSDVVFGIGTVMFAAAIGGYAAGLVGTWLGASIAAGVQKSSVVRVLVGGAGLASVYGWTANLIGGNISRGAIPFQYYGMGRY